MKLRSIFLSLVLLLVFNLISTSMQAQDQQSLREKADMFYDELQYSKAAGIYRKLTDTPKPRQNDMERLAECYMKMNKYEDAEIWYARTVADSSSNPDNLVFLGEMMKANTHYTEAKDAFWKYIEKTSDKKRVWVSMQGCDSASVWISNPTNHKIFNEQTINSGLSEFSVLLLSERKAVFIGEPYVKDRSKKYGWTGNAFLKIFSAERMANNKLKTRALSDTYYNNEQFHVGPISMNKAGNTFFITRTYPGKNGNMSSINGKTYYTQNMELYIQSKVKGLWQSPQPFEYNDVQNYSLGQAVLSKDEKVLYFVSDMPGGVGGKDIWYSELMKNGTWGKCRNAGTILNSPGDEMFPTVGPDGTLYFSSNGLPGMGGLDIFTSKGTKGKWSKPVNMRYPVNSPGDDFSYVSIGDQSRGYLSSNRVNGNGGDDIYSFEDIVPVNMLILEGIVYDKKTGLVLPDAVVTLYDSNNNIVAKQNSNLDGYFSFEIDKPNDYLVKGTKIAYYPDTTSILIPEPLPASVRKLALYLDPLEKGKTFKIENILYNFDKDNIRTDASLIMNDLVNIMHENPTLKIELGSHTDCRGTNKYNEDLSQRRAQSAVNYLVTRGISRDRMVAKGYGESRLINRCADGVPCSPAEHQQNRRTEFTILSY